MGSCAGEEFAAIAGISILSSYLFLFISFYLATYSAKSKKHSKKEDHVRKGLRRMSQAPLPDPTDLLHKAIQSNAGSPDAKSTGYNSLGRATKSRKV